MENLRKFGFLGADGKPLDDRLSKVLNALLPRFRRRFPALQDDVEVTEAFEEAARRITKREQASGPIEKLGGYAWKALESIGVSRQRRGSMQIRFNRVEWLRGGDGAWHPAASARSTHDARRGPDLQPEGVRLHERGDREASGQLGEFGRQGHEPLEAKNPFADGSEGVDNSRKARIVSGI